MIVLDIETSGLDTGKYGIWQIGAIDLDNLENYFLEEARIDDENLVEGGALTVTGKTEKELRNENKQSQKRLILNFIEWAKSSKIKVIVGQNIGWDLNFLQNKCFRYGLYNEFNEVLGSKGLDLYALAQLVYLKKEGKYRLKENGRGKFSVLPVVSRILRSGK